MSWKIGHVTISKGPWDTGKPKGPQRPSGGRGDREEDPAEIDIDQLLKKGREQFESMFGGGGGGGGRRKKSGNGGGFGAKFYVFLFIILSSVWFLTGFYVVQPDQEAVVLRFGEYNRVTAPGLNYALPKPIEKVLKVSVTTNNREEIGFKSVTVTRNGLEQEPWKDVPKESLMVTGDQNIISIHFEVQWRIKVARDFLFNVRNLPNESTVKSVAESAMREVIGRTQIAFALDEGRFTIADETKKLLQITLDEYGAGVEILKLNLLRVDPPKKVIAAFRDVQDAKSQQETVINKGYAYRNDIVPRARGEAEQIIQNASAYKEEVMARASGQAERFVSIYNEYKKAKAVTKKRIYLETFEEIFSDMDKMIIDNQATGSGVVPYLPLDQLKKQNQ